MVLTRAQCRKEEVTGSGAPRSGVTANVTLGGTPSKAAADWAAGGGSPKAAADPADGQALALAWLSLVLFVFGAALLFASVSHTAYRLAAGAS